MAVARRLALSRFPGQGRPCFTKSVGVVVVFGLFSVWWSREDAFLRA